VTTASAEVAVRVDGLRKRYGDKLAVSDVSFEVNRGEIFGLLGPNGSGKTTTVECIQGLRRSDAGHLQVFGLDPQTDTARVRTLIGSQLQESALPDRMKVWEALRLFSISRNAAGSWETLLREWGLEDRRTTAFGDLSGGQKQRLFVALALVGDPKLVILDEMTTGLDPAARRMTWNLIETVRDRGTTVILVTHFMDEAERLCDRLALLSSGRVVAEGTIPDLIESAGGRSEVRFTAGGDVGFLHGVEGVASLEVGPDGLVTVIGTGPLLARVAHAIVERGMTPPDLSAHLPSLEDVYMRMVGDAGAES
jgi:ABC-2 type transport system ATP-binding protein